MAGLKPIYRIYLIIAIVAAAVTMGVQFLLRQSVLPYRFKLIVSSEISTKWEDWRYYYPRLNDRYSHYSIMIVNEGKSGWSYAKIYNPKSLVDQFNFNHPIDRGTPIYDDYNGDGSKEVFLVSHDNEWLYLSIIDVLKGEFLVKERPILPAGPQKARKEWDLALLFSEITDLDNDGEKELVLNIYTGFAHYPRCLCAISLKDFRIIRRFDHHLGFGQFAVFDANRDSKKEIILWSYASFNFPPDVYLSDAFSWLVVLDENFKPLKAPRKLGEKFTGIALHPLPRESGFTAVIIYPSPDLKKSILELLNHDYETVRKAAPDFRIASAIVDSSNHEIKFFCNTEDSRLLELNSSLEVTRHFSVDFGMGLRLSGFLELPGQPERFIFARNTKGLLLLDTDARLQAQLPIKEIRQAKFLPLTEDSYPILNVNTKMDRMYFRLLPTPAFQWIQWAWLPVFLLSFSLLTASHWALNRILQYFSFFLYSLLSSDNAIILLDHRGRIISFNRKVKEMLHLPSPLRRRRHFQMALAPRSEVVETIRQSMEEGKKNRRNYSFEEAEKSFIGEITVTPFRSYLQFINAYLVEIKDSTREVLLERQQNWQRNIRRIVHDLKTPLAGVQLKLQALYMHLTENNHDVEQSVLDSLETAHQELLRIRNITQDFLKFSDLRQINPQRVRLQDIITQSIQPFRLYFTQNLVIDLQLEQRLPEWVYWDSRQIEILLHILLENSLDALAGSGKIKLKAGSVRDKNNDKCEKVIFKVIDNGPGIPEEIQEKIFEPHFTTKQEGSGLGLTFAKHIAQSHGGSIHFTSRATAGTIFVIELPVNTLVTNQRDENAENFGH